MSEAKATGLLAECRRGLAFAEGLSAQAAAMARQRALPEAAEALRAELGQALAELRASLGRGEGSAEALARSMGLARDLDRLLRPLQAAAWGRGPGALAPSPPRQATGPLGGPAPGTGPLPQVGGRQATGPLPQPAGPPSPRRPATGPLPPAGGPAGPRRQATTPLPGWGDLTFPPLPGAGPQGPAKAGPAKGTGALPQRPAPPRGPTANLGPRTTTGPWGDRPKPSPKPSPPPVEEGAGKLSGWLNTWLKVDPPAPESGPPPEAPELQQMRLALKLVGSVLAYVGPRLAVVEVALRALGATEAESWWDVADRLDELTPSLPPSGQGWAAPLARMFHDQPPARRPAVIAVGQWGATREAFEACDLVRQQAEQLPSPEGQRRCLALAEVGKLKGLAVPLSHLHLSFKDHVPLRDLFPTPAKPAGRP